LRPSPIVALGTPDNTRELILVEEVDEYDRLLPMLGTSALGPLAYNDSITENPQLNTIEEWQVINNTMDAHPIHLHQVCFQLIKRQDYDVMQYTPGVPSSLVLLGSPEYPGAEEQGWEDTQIMYPGEVTTIRAYFDIPGLYLWHCHILSHEDHDMMRPFYVGDLNNIAVTKNNLDFSVSGRPNPFSGSLNLTMEISTSGRYKIQIYDMLGSEIRTIADKYFTKGKHDFFWNGTTASGREALNGMYFIKVSGNGNEQNIKIIRNR
jgi:spore coat protein A